MKILALEFSAPVRSVAVIAGPSTGLAEQSGGRDLKPFALIDAALAQAGATRGDIECIAVGLGPGSHAGIRIAIALAQGWQLGRGVRLLGISSAEVVAAQLGQAGRARVCLALDAQRGELFAARYDASAWKRPRLVEPFRALSAAERAGLDRGGELYRMDLPTGPSTVVPGASMLALLATERAGFVSGDVLEPIYLRPAEFVKAPPPKFGGS